MVSKITLKKDQNIARENAFVVKNSPYIQWFIAFFMGALGISSLIYDTEHNATAVSVLALSVGVVFLIKSFNQSAVITVNDTGIYSGRQLVTDWPHFAGASFTELERKRVRVSDNFVLLVHYSKDKIPGYFKTTIPLGNLQDKSEEEVVAAVYAFYQKFKTGRISIKDIR